MAVTGIGSAAQYDVWAAWGVGPVVPSAPKPHDMQFMADRGKGFHTVAGDGVGDVGDQKQNALPAPGDIERHA
jgi:hypothetical protein